jgi:ABC-type lipoprotein release transport system permease subunit
MRALDTIGLLLGLAIRNVFARKAKSLIVGSIIFFGTMLVVLGDALLDSVEQSMARSVVNSLSGHLQVYSADAKDALDLFPAMSLFDYDYGVITSFSRLQEVLLRHANVQAVIPMGPEKAMMTIGNDLDRNLARLREAVRQQDRGEIEAVAAHVRRQAELLQQDYVNLEKLAARQEYLRENQEQLARAVSDEFWAGFDTDPLAALEFLENRIAPLSYDAKQTFMFYLGTDLERFPKYFDLFEVVKGEMVPPGKRGFMFSETFYEQQVKHPVATVLDELRKALHDKGKSLSEDKFLRDLVEVVSRQYKRITYQLYPAQAEELEIKLRALLRDADSSLSELVEEFLRVNDANFDERYLFFNEHIAPLLALYDIPVGDVLTIKTFTKSGYLKSVNVKVYGTFRFKGLEGSDITGIYSLMDLMTFRDLYGYMTEEKLREIEEIRRQFDVVDVDRTSAEDALFGEDSELVTAGDEGEGFATDFEIGPMEERYEELFERVYSREELEDGVIVNAAVILKDASRLEQSRQELQALLEEEGLGLKVVDWQTAAGLVGQYITMVRIVLYVAIFIIFTVALVIINNSMVMATLERIGEIGTMRAIGAGRSFVLAMFLLETLALGLITGGLGALGGAGLILYWNNIGLPAPNEFFIFFFGGPRLFPEVGLANLGFGLVVILVVSIISTLYPALIATRVQPVEAMQARE